MYKRCMHKYPITEVVIHLIYILLFLIFGSSFGFLCVGGTSYMFLQMIVHLIFSSEFKKKGDPILKEHYPDLYERYMGKDSSSIRKLLSYMPSRKDDIRPIPAAQFLLLDKKLTADILNDKNIKNMRDDAKLYVLGGLLAILPFILAFVVSWLLAAIMFIKSII